jgi:hypothetical protein
MTLLLKDPGATLEYQIDWGADYLVATGDALAASSWSVSPVDEGGVVIASSQFDLLVSTVTVGGGRPGRIYRVTNQVVTAAGREDRRSIMLRVEQR